jgi:hypothetical protein
LIERLLQNIKVFKNLVEGWNELFLLD